MSGCSNGQVTSFVLDSADSWKSYEGPVPKTETEVVISDSGISLPSSTEYAINQVVRQFPAELTVASMAVGRCGIVYLLDTASHTVWTYDSNQSLFNRLPAIEGLLTSPVALAYEDGTLFVADTGTVKVFALALLTGQIRWTAGADLASADGSVFTPVSLVAGPHQHLYALDSKNSKVVHFDAHGQLLELLDIPATLGSPLSALARARDGTLYVVAGPPGGPNTVLQRLPLGHFATLLPAAPDSSFKAASLAVDSNRVIYVGGPNYAKPPLAINRYDSSGKPLGVLPAYSGAADLLAIDSTDTLYAFCLQPPTLSLLQPTPTYVIPSNSLPATAYYYSTSFDSGSVGTRWHRLVIKADPLKPNTQFFVFYSATDVQTPPKSWSPPLVNPKDALLIQASGQYLYLQFKLVGTESATPVVHSVQIYYPRVSYLRYLPAIYSQDPASRDFLERFLSIFESIFSRIETATANIVRYFDPRVVTGDFLRWLAQWLAIVVDDTWTDDQLRTLLLRAPDLFRERGTPAEIAEVIRIYLGIPEPTAEDVVPRPPFIVEKFQLDCAQDADIQNVYNKLYGGDAFCFCVLVPPYLQQGTAVKGKTQGYADPDQALFTAPVELVYGAHSYGIWSTSLHGLSDAINVLALGVVAEVHGDGPAATPYYLTIRARRIGPRNLDLRTKPGDATSSILTLTDPGSYTVVSPWTQESRDALQRILDLEKPAHTCGGIQILQPRTLLDMHSYLEVNSWLVKPSPLLDTGAAIPLDSVVDDPTPIGQAGVRSRLGLDTVLG
jgi:phage tail-like protein